MLTRATVLPDRMDLQTAAAYQVLMARVQPLACITNQREEEIRREFISLESWICNQTIEIASGYRAAITEMLKDIRTRVSQYEWAAEVQEELKSFPRP
jgi:hypothetical protein